MSRQTRYRDENACTGGASREQTLSQSDGQQSAALPYPESKLSVFAPQNNRVQGRPTAPALQRPRLLEARAPSVGYACNPGVAAKNADIPLSRPTSESESALPARPTRPPPP